MTKRGSTSSVTEALNPTQRNCVHTTDIESHTKYQTVCQKAEPFEHNQKIDTKVDQSFLFLWTCKNMF